MTRSQALFLSAVLAVVSANPVRAQQPTPGASDASQARPAAASSNAEATATREAAETETVQSRDAWTRFKSRLETRGIAIGVETTSDLSRIAAARTGTHNVGRILASANADFDLAKLTGWLHGASASVQFYSKRGSNGVDRAGDVQGFSNIDVPSFAHFGEVWYQQRLVADRLRVKAGRLDANGDFALVEAAADFLNSSMGYSPTILVLPTYPNPKPGIVLAADPTSHLGFRIGTYDVEDACEHVASSKAHAFVVGEVRAQWSLPGRGLTGRAGAGVWRHTGHLRADGGYFKSLAHSPFSTVEQTLWSEPGADDGGRAVTAFAQFGTAAANQGVDRHVSGGLVWRGPFRAASEDVLGTAVTSARVTTIDAEIIVRQTETTIATFYKRQIAGWLAVQPDIQYIAHPGGIAERRRTIAVTCRILTEF